MSVRRSLAAPNDIVSQYISSRPHFVEDHVIEGRIQSFVCVYVDYVIHSVQPRDEFRGILKVRVYPVGPGYLESAGVDIGQFVVNLYSVQYAVLSQSSVQA